MGYWSVFAPVDYMDEHSDYPVSLSPDAATARVMEVVPRPGRVTLERDDAGKLVATTVKNTPAWAWIIPLGWALIRRNCYAQIEVTAAPGGSLISARGKLDNRAATRLRALRNA
jgi:hypothetical protein